MNSQYLHGLIEIVFYCRALATGVHAEYLFLTLSNVSHLAIDTRQRNIRAVWLVAGSAPRQRRSVLLWLPDSNLSLEELVSRGRLVDHV
jgi:hypothetical protein